MPMMQVLGGKGMQRLGSWLLQMWTEARVLLEGRAVAVRTGLQLRGGMQSIVKTVTGKTIVWNVED